MEKYFPFDDVNGDRLYSSEDFREYYATLFKNGVFTNVGSGLQITESASLGMRVHVNTGAMAINGGLYQNTEESELIIPVASSLQDRTDSIVIQMDLDNRLIQLLYKQADTTVTRTDSIYEMQLCTILVAKNASNITNADITDKRSDDTVCGYSSPFEQVTGIGDIEAQWNSKIQAWYDNLVDQLTEDQAINLQQQITALQSSKADDTEVMHLAGDESATGTKSFENLQVSGTASVENLVVSDDVPLTSGSAGIYSWTYFKKNGVVDFEIAFFNNTSSTINISSNQVFNVTLPERCRPPKQWLIDCGYNNPFRFLYLYTDGRVVSGQSATIPVNNRSIFRLTFPR
jgi:uncharacterized protein (DUF427 family)